MALTYQTYYPEATTLRRLEKKVHDNIFNPATVTLKELISRMRIETGIQYERIIGYDKPTGASRARLGQLANTTTLTGLMETRSLIANAYYDWPLVLADEDILESGGDIALADYTSNRIRYVSEAAREDIETAIWTAQTGNAMYSLVDAIGDGTYQGIATADFSNWTSCIMESNTSAYPDTGVSPSLENHQKMVRVIADTCGSPPDVIITSGAVFDHLRGKLTANDYVAAQRNEYSIKWGVQSFFIA